MRISYDKDVIFLGRNGEFRCAGLEVKQYGGIVVQFEPVTSKGEVGRCVIEMPVDKLDELIGVLSEIRRKVVGADIKLYETSGA